MEALMTDAPEQQPVTPTETPQTQPPAVSRAIVVTWLGEDYEQTMENEHGEMEKMPVPGPSFMYFAGRRFDRGKPELIDPDNEKDVAKKAAFEHILLKAPKMKTTFKVEAPKAKKAEVTEPGTEGEPEHAEGSSERDEPEQEVRTQPRMAPIPKRRR
jgi:hypothetical protein